MRAGQAAVHGAASTSIVSSSDDDDLLDNDDVVVTNAVAIGGPATLRGPNIGAGEASMLQRSVTLNSTSTTNNHDSELSFNNNSGGRNLGGSNLNPFAAAMRSNSGASGSFQTLIG